MIIEAASKFAEIITKNTNYIFISLVFGILGTGLNPRNRTLYSYLISFLAALCIGALSGYYLEDRGFEESTVFVIVAVISIVAKDLIEFALNLMGHLNKSSKAIVESVTKKVLDRF